MPDGPNDHAFGCGCDGGCDRREFLSAVGLVVGAVAGTSLPAADAEVPPITPPKKDGAKIRAAFLYPPSNTFAADPNGWWSWPGNEFDAEGRQQKYTAAIREMEQRLDLRVTVDAAPIASREHAERLAQELKANPPDGLLLMMFYNGSLATADLLLKAAEASSVPVIFYIGLGVKHGPITQYRRPGVYFIQSLENLAAIEYGLRMINAKQRMRQSRLLSITEADAPREGVEGFLGTTVQVIPFARYADEFHKVAIDEAARRWIARVTSGAKEVRGVTPPKPARTRRGRMVPCRSCWPRNTPTGSA